MNPATIPTSTMMLASIANIVASEISWLSFLFPHIGQEKGEGAASDDRYCQDPTLKADT